MTVATSMMKAAVKTIKNTPPCVPLKMNNVTGRRKANRMILVMYSSRL